MSVLALSVVSLRCGTWSAIGVTADMLACRWSPVANDPIDIGDAPSFVLEARLGAWVHIASAK